jgi:hypothetical protein
MLIRIPRIIALLAVLLATRTAAAQNGPEIIKGKITDDSAHAIVASIMVTRGPDRLTQQTTSDSSGNYSTRFEQGTGDYLVYVSAPGFKAARRRVQRQANETELVANFSLARDIATLEAVRVSATRPVRATNPITPTRLRARCRMSHSGHPAHLYSAPVRNRISTR